jgi:hypothetical protein
MATPRYRIIDAKGAYMPRSPELHVLALGTEHQDAAVYNIRAPVYEHLKQGTDVEFIGTPGPHLEPLNEEASEAIKAYWVKFPNASLDPTRSMPNGQDPMGGRTVEQLVNGLLEAMDQTAQAAAAAAPVPASIPYQGPSPEFAALLAGQKVMQDTMAALIATLTTALAPPATKGRAA